MAPERRCPCHPAGRVGVGILSASLAVLGLLLSQGVGAQSTVSVVQADWSGGAVAVGSVADWGRGFATTEGVSWRALAGQLALAATPLATPAKHVLDSATGGAIKVFAGDLDGDGDTDVLAAAYGDDTITAFINDGGDPISWRKQVVVTGFTHTVGLSAADVDRDGRLDILGGAGESGVVSWWRNGGGDPPAWTRFGVDASFMGAHDVAAADLDGDGDVDLVGAAWVDDQIAWWRNDGGTPIAWTKLTIANGFDYACNLDLADVDGDGNVDVVATAWNAQEIRWWRNDGGDSPAWTAQTIAQGFAGTHWVECADVDGDGRLDVLAAAMDRAEVAWWRNDGGEPIGWVKHTLAGPLAGAVSVAAGDLDGDGDDDAAGAGWSASGGVTWWENRDGSGTSWTRRRLDALFANASSVHLADVDGDGALDVLATSFTLNHVAWWRVSQFQSSGTLTSSILESEAPVLWQSWSADLVTPPGTQVVVEARAGDDPETMDPWLELVPQSPPGFSGRAHLYLQYRLTLSTVDPTVSPIVREIGFTGTSAVGPALRAPRRKLSSRGGALPPR